MTSLKRAKLLLHSIILCARAFFSSLFERVILQFHNKLETIKKAMQWKFWFAFLQNMWISRFWWKLLQHCSSLPLLISPKPIWKVVQVVFVFAIQLHFKKPTKKNRQRRTKQTSTAFHFNFLMFAWKAPNILRQVTENTHSRTDNDGTRIIILITIKWQKKI